MKFVQVNCDHCNETLDENNLVEVLPLGTTLYPVEGKPWLTNETHFCNFRCLQRWLARKMES